MKNRLTVPFAAIPLVLVILLTVCDASPVGVPPFTPDPVPGGTDTGRVQNECYQGGIQELENPGVREVGTCELES